MLETREAAMRPVPERASMPHVPRDWPQRERLHEYRKDEGKEAARPDLPWMSEPAVPGEGGRRKEGRLSRTEAGGASERGCSEGEARRRKGEAGEEEEERRKRK